MASMPLKIATAAADKAKAQRGPSRNQQTSKKPPLARKRGPDPQEADRTKRLKKTPDGNDVSNVSLYTEVQALGGDEDDLELVRAAESRSESGLSTHEQRPDRALQDEVAAVAGKLGLKKGHDRHVTPQPAHRIKPKSDVVRTSETGDIHDGTKSRFSRLSSSRNVKPPQSGHSSQTIVNLKKHAKNLREAEEEAYKSAHSGSTSRKFLATIMSSGTLSDKVSALTLAFQESPTHNVKAFESLMGLASKKNRTHATGALGALVDLLGLGSALPHDRKLHYFHSQPELQSALGESHATVWTLGQALPGTVQEKNLVAWAFEDWLKESYFKLIQLLEVWCSDEIEYCRIRGLDFVYMLLKEKPEQESNLLRLLVGKLGDGERRVSSRASYLLLQLQNSHPGMRVIIAQCVERELLLNPASGVRANYCAINTLNQTILSNKDPKTSEVLIRIYFDLFLSLFKTGYLNTADPKEDSDAIAGHLGAGRTRRNTHLKSRQDSTEPLDKLVSAILTGINRAVPFVSASAADFEGHLDTLFRVSHTTNFNTSIQALLLIQQLTATMHVATDRFYRTLYESLLDPRLATSSKHGLYIMLLIRAINNDVDVRRVKAFAKRMLQVVGLHQVPLSCGILHVVSQARLAFPDLATMLNVPEDDELNEASDGASSYSTRYDGRKRDPGHSNAHRCCLWEVEPLIGHFHPSVEFHAQSVIFGPKMLPKPDLESHTLIKFLDKLAFRAPKTSEPVHGASIMQPLYVSSMISGEKRLPSGDAINTPSFWNKKLEDVSPEDVFFHQYFAHTPRQRGVKTKLDATEDSDNEIWKALVASTEHGADAGMDLSGSEADFSIDSDSESAVAGVSSSDIEDGSSDAVTFGDGDGDEDEDEDDDEDEMIDGRVVGIKSGKYTVPGQGMPGQNDQPRRSRRRALRDLPTFAAVEDYEALLAKDE